MERCKQCKKGFGDGKDVRLCPPCEIWLCQDCAKWEISKGVVVCKDCYNKSRKKP